jgi:hypothetical protein
MHTKFWSEKPEVKSQLGRPRRRWECNIGINLEKRGSEGVNWIHLAHDGDRWRVLVNTVMNRRFP